MKKSLKTIAASLLSSLSLSLIPSATFAEDVCSSEANEEVKRAAGCFGNDNGLPEVITVILYSIIAVIGIVAVIYIIIGGINYMTSAGDSAKLDKARKTILYAVIGIIICVIAFALVNLVIGFF